MSSACLWRTAKSRTTHPCVLDVILRSLSKAELERKVLVLLIVVGFEGLALIIFVDMAAAAEEVVRLAGDAGVVLEDVAKLSAATSGSAFRPAERGKEVQKKKPTSLMVKASPLLAAPTLSLSCRSEG